MAIVVEAPWATESGWSRWVAREFLNDPRDVVFVNVSLGTTLILLPFAATLFYMNAFGWGWAALYWTLLFGLLLDRFTLMLHCTSHRPLYNKRFRFLNHYIPWVLGPFLGQTPNSYFVHHMGMHHVEGNLHDDLSTTLSYQRDRFSHWLRYYLKFLLVGLAELTAYHHRAGRKKMVRRLLSGEFSFWLLVLGLGVFVSWQATLVVFVLPTIVVRGLMFAGNWGQHAFVDAHDPGNDFKNSITCINSRYNRRCFNDGYHIIHHLKPSLHYSEMATEFDDNREQYGAEDAIVFSGIDFVQVWFFLMTKRHQSLVRAFVRLPGAPERTDAQVLQMLQSRLSPVPR